MKLIHKLPRKLRMGILIALLAGTSMVSFAFVDSYFEISKNLEIFATLYREVNTYYVDDVDPNKFVRSGIDAMLKTLDPYTNYISETEIEDYRFMTTGQYGGIGSLISIKDDYVQITEPYDGYPAQKAGLLAGDLIVEVDGKSVKGKTTDEVSKLLKGQPKTEVKLLIQRVGSSSPITKLVMREEIKVKNVPYFGMVNNEIGLIKLTGFTNDAGKEVKDALLELKKNKSLKAVILDLRGNPGGLLNEAVNISNIFVKKGQVVVSTKGKVKEWDKEYKTFMEATDTEIPLAVLTSSNSASASEIVAGTIQDLDRGVIIGQKSFGKGLVQATRPLAYNTQLKVTTAKYYIPSGRCIQAINYADKDGNNKAKKYADSLKTAFKTKNGRLVYDGGGILPDIKTDPKKFANITISLLQKRLIFDYATLYRSKNEALANAAQFDFSDEHYADFLKFLDGKEYDYTTESEKALEELKSKAEKEKYFDALSAEYNALKAKMSHDKNQDLQKHKNEIKKLLEEEIVARYYFQRGRIEASFDHDLDVLEAVKALSNTEEYQNILKAK